MTPQTSIPFVPSEVRNSARWSVKDLQLHSACAAIGAKTIANKINALFICKLSFRQPTGTFHCPRRVPTVDKSGIYSFPKFRPIRKLFLQNAQDVIRKIIFFPFALKVP